MQIEMLSQAETIADEWQDLWERDPAATPFQSPAWLLSWRRQFLEGETRLLALRDHGRLVGLLPLFRHGGRYLPWGAGTTDRLDGLFEAGLDPAAWAAGLRRLDAPVEFLQLGPASPLLRAPAPAGWRARTEGGESCLVLPLPAPVSPKFAGKLRYYGRKATRSGVDAPRRGTPDHFDALVDLHTRRWRENGEDGIFADPRMVAWLRESLPVLDAKGWLRLYVLERDGDPIGALCVLCARARAYYYIGGFDPAQAGYAPGTILVGHAIREAEREGCSSFDFLRGREPYKYRWGAREEPTYGRRYGPQ